MMLGLVKSSLLLLVALPSGADAFSSAPSSSSSLLTGTRRAAALHAATLDEIPTEPFFPTHDELLRRTGSEPSSSVNTALQPPSESPTIASADSVQSRTIDKDTLINGSIFLLAIGIVLERILSVDVGITRGWSPTEIAERIPLDNWRSYTNILNMAPLQTKAATSATVYAIGDILAQRTEGVDMGRLDRGRIGRSLAAGLIGHGPMSHVWYHLSESFFDDVLHLHAWWDFVPKVVVDQTIFGPIWNNSYILLLGLMQFQKPSQIWSDMKRTTVPLIVEGLKLWPFVHCITYGLIPVENRLLWVDAVEIVWVTILAKQASSLSGDEEDDAIDANKGGDDLR